MLSVSVWCACVCAACATFLLTPELRTSEGRLRGLRGAAGVNRYYGIPYATSRRLQRPGPAPRWRGVLVASSRLGHCAQAVSVMRLGREDCLQLDVYAPDQRTRTALLPVMVFLHGGAYYYGTKAHYDPEFLVTKGVVVVIVNYRVGALGFLCVHSVANLGLKDQVAALKWIQRNIAAFGGDPDNVTISGQSAGASAAAMHMLSRSSRGLFHKAILMSGTPLSPWAYNMQPLEPALEDAKKMSSKKVVTEADVYNTFLNASLEDILTSCAGVSNDIRYFKYAPCDDSHLPDAFFHDTPYDTIKSGDFAAVPMIAGFTSAEGVLFYGINDDRTFREWDENFEERLPSVFAWLPEAERRAVARKLRAHYFGSRRIGRQAVSGVVDIYSDWIAYSSGDAFARLMSRYSPHPVYQYLFSYEGGRNFAKALLGGGARTHPGASHSDDIFYVFKPGGLNLPLAPRDATFIHTLTTMITDFMKHGDPTPATSPVGVRWSASSNTSRVLRLDRRPVMQELPAEQRGHFLLSMLCRRGRRGYVPCDNTHTMAQYNRTTNHHEDMENDDNEL